MTELQCYLLGLLREIDEICRKNKIEYYLTGGSLIGAIRHKGFIPWDDDIDIMMTRDQWERFFACRDQLPEGRELGCREIDETEALDIRHYIDVNTTFISRYHVTNPAPAGKWIDILILDPLPDDEDAIADYKRAVTESAELVNMSYHYALRLGENTRFPQHYARAQQAGLKKTVDEIMEKALSYPELTSPYCTQRYAGAMPVWRMDYYGTPKYVPFEDTMLPVPARPYECLTIGYGAEWMNIPQDPADRRNHESLISSLTVPYQEVLDDFERHIDRDDMMSVFLERKYRWDEVNEEKTRLEAEKLQFAAAAVKYRFSRDAEGIDPAALAEAGDFDRLRDLFEFYFRWQGDRNLIGSSSVSGWRNWYFRCNPVLIDIGDDALYAACCVLLFDERFQLCSRILDARRRIERPVPETLRRTEKYLRAVLQLNACWYEKEYETCRELLRKAEDHFPVKRSAEKYDLLLTYRESGTDDSLWNRLESLLRKYPLDADLLSLQADITLAKGAVQSAAKIYGTVVRNTRNGLLLQHVKGVVQKELTKQGAESELWESLYWEVCSACGETSGQQKDQADASRQDSEPSDDVLPSAMETPLAERRFALLKEIDHICRSSRIPYFLAGSALLQAVRTGKLVNAGDDIGIFIKAEDVKVFAEAVRREARPDRYLQSLETDQDFDRFALRYGDTDSLDYSIERAGKSRFYGLYVSVEIIRPVSDRAGDRLHLKLERAWEANQKTPARPTAVRAVDQKLLRCVMTVHHSTAAWLYRKLLHDASTARGAPAEVFRKPFGKSAKKYPSVLFEETQDVLLEGVPFMTCAKPEAFLTADLGEGWEKRSLTRRSVDPFMRIQMADLPYRDYLAYLESQSIDTEHFWQLWRKVDLAYSKIRQLGKQADRYWELMKASKERLEQN